LEFDSPQYQSVKMQALAGYKAAQQAEKDALERDMENDDE
jgi:O-methyltransferase involved in polyketide biosynthesis